MPPRVSLARRWHPADVQAICYYLDLDASTGLIRWLRAYLYSRSLYIKLEGSRATIARTITGAPQDPAPG